jgi:hypothetical protein
MSPSVLGHLTLGYQLVWNRLRQIAAVHLFVESPGTAPVDAEHLLRTLAQAWSLQSPTLILSVQSPSLLADLLLHAVSTSPWIAVQGRHVERPAACASGARRPPAPGSDGVARRTRRARKPGHRRRIPARYGLPDTG